MMKPSSERIYNRHFFFVVQLFGSNGTQKTLGRKENIFPMAKLLGVKKKILLKASRTRQMLNSVVKLGRFPCWKKSKHCHVCPPCF